MTLSAGRLIVVMTILVTACGGPSSGTVIEKHHEDARDWLMCITIGKNPCGSLIPMHDDEHWVLTLRNCTSDCDTGDVDVPRDVWKETRVGDHYEQPS